MLRYAPSITRVMFSSLKSFVICLSKSLAITLIINFYFNNPYDVSLILRIMYQILKICIQLIYDISFINFANSEYVSFRYILTNHLMREKKE